MKQKLEQLQRLEQVKRDYREVFGTPAGKRVLEDIAIGCNFYRPLPTDPVDMGIAEGMRRAYLFIKDNTKEYQEPEEKKAIK